MKSLPPLFVVGIWSVLLKWNVVLGDEACHDNLHYRLKADQLRDCTWLFENDWCDAHEEKYGNHIGKHYCPYSCGYCSDYEYESHDDHFDDDYDDHFDDHHDDQWIDQWDDHWDGDEHWDDHYDDQYYNCHDDERYRYDSVDWKDCKWVADEQKCDLKEHGKDIGDYYCPYSCGHCYDQDIDDDHYHYYCFDDNDFRYDDVYWKDCEWVAKEDRCNREQNGYHVGKYYCPLSCDYCYDWQVKPTRKPTRKPTSDHTCRDDDEYRYYGDEWKDCEWIYENDRCDRVRNGKHVGSTYCPKSCRHCNDSHKPPTKQPTPPTRKPTSYECHNALELNSNCYEDHYPENMVVTFTNCDAKEKDWIGIYDVRLGNLGANLKWWGTSYVWKYAGCRSCQYPPEEGVVRFSDWSADLKDGEYRAYLFENDGYHVKATSDTFQVGECNHHPPTRKPSTPTRRPIIPTRRPTTPTRNPNIPTRMPRPPTRMPHPPTRMPRPPTNKPISFCRSSLEVENYCYKDKNPERIKFLMKNCSPESKDWVAIYKVRYEKELGNTKEWWGKSLLWQYACGSQECDHGQGEATLFFENWWRNLENGDYKVYLFDNDSYEVKSMSDTFAVGESYCVL